MKKKMRRFADGGETTDMLPKSALDRLAEGEESGMFDKDVYARARKFMREQAARGDEEPSAPRAAPRAMPAAPAARPTPMAAGRAAPAARPTPMAAGRAEIPVGTPMAAGRAEIPVDTSLKAPAREGRMMGETERNIRNILNATTPGLMRGVAAVAAPLATAAVRGAQAGRNQAAMAREIGRAAEAAPASAARTPVARTAESGMRFTPKQELEAAESTVRGAVGRKAIQAAREPEAQVARATARGAADRKRIQAARAAGKKKEAEAMEEAKPVLQASKKRMSPRGRTRDEMEDYELRAKGGKISGYAKGGSVRGSGCEQRGLRKCKVV